MECGDRDDQADGKMVSGCGDMTAVEIPPVGVNSEIDTHVEGYDDYL